MTKDPEEGGIPNPIAELASSFKALEQAPAGFWYANAAYWLDGVAYFGMLTLLAMFLHDIVGLSDTWGHRYVAIYTGLITGSMLVFGGRVEKIGIRRSLIISVVLFLVGRVALTMAPTAFTSGTMALLVFCGAALVVAAAGNGFMQPAVYAAVKQYTTEETSAMGYGLLYAGMNLGIVLIGLVSSRIRTGLHIEGLIDFDGFGITGVFWFCIAVNVLMLFMMLFLLTARREASAQHAGADPTAEETASEPAETRAAGLSLSARVGAWFRDAPLSNGRFMFFIFALMPVQTLFAYQWLVMPQFVTRAYSQAVADNMESIVNIANPLIIVLGVPVITALTRKVAVYKVMIVGSLVSAVPTFLFLLGPSFPLLMVYIVFFSLGEALWQPRFLQLAAELAPEGRTGAYIAYANLPWFLIKAVAGLWTGPMMEAFCPAEGPTHTEFMWLVYAGIAMLSPIVLVAGRQWVVPGMAKSAS